MLSFPDGTMIGRLPYKLSNIVAAIPSNIEGGSVPTLASRYALECEGDMELVISSLTLFRVLLGFELASHHSQHSLPRYLYYSRKLFR